MQNKGITSNGSCLYITRQKYEKKITKRTDLENKPPLAMADGTYGERSNGSFLWALAKSIYQLDNRRMQQSMDASAHLGIVAIELWDLRGE